SVTPSSASVNTNVTINGTGFGAVQSNGQVWLGSTYGHVVTWGDQQIVATAVSGSITGVARVQQNGIWSNAKAFAVTPSDGSTPITLAPDMFNMVVRGTATIQALN